MYGVAAEITKEISVLFQHSDLYARPGQQVAEQDACGASADNATSRFQSLIWHWSHLSAYFRGARLYDDSQRWRFGDRLKQRRAVATESQGKGVVTPRGPKIRPPTPDRGCSLLAFQSCTAVFAELTNRSLFGLECSRGCLPVLVVACRPISRCDRSPGAVGRR